MASLCRSTLNRIVAVGAFVAGAALAVSAVAAPANDMRTCSTASGEAAIAACTRTIESGKFKGLTLGLLYAIRGVEWSKTSQHDRAIADYDQAITLNPKHALAYNGRANARRAKGDIDGAIADYDQAIRLDPKLAFVHDLRGNAYRAKGQYDRAIADYDQAIRLDPRLIFAHNSRGLIYLGLGQLDRAIADYDAALKLDRRQARSLYGRGVAKLKKGDTAGGNADITAAKAIQADVVEEFARHGILATDNAAGSVQVPKPQAASAPAADCKGAETHWKSAEEIRTLAVYQDHMARFPNCDFAALAAARIQAMKK